jgi:hypothetical protein
MSAEPNGIRKMLDDILVRMVAALLFLIVGIGAWGLAEVVTMGRIISQIDARVEQQSRQLSEMDARIRAIERNTK